LFVFENAGFFNINRAIVEVAAAAKKMLFGYSGLCRMTSDAVDAVRSAIPKGFKFYDF